MQNLLNTYIEKALFETADLDANGGYLSTQQARSFLRDAIESTEILRRGDNFDSASKKFEVPKINFSSRIMHAGTEGSRGTSSKPGTGLVTLSTELFKGEVPVSDEMFEDNVEQDALADSIMALIASAVGRDLEDTAIKSDTGDANADYNKFDGIVQSLVDAADNIYDAVADTSYQAILKGMIAALPVRYRSNWQSMKFYVTPDFADGYADEIGARATALGDSAVQDKAPLRFRSIELIEVPLMDGTQNTVDYSKFAILCEPMNLKVGWHRRVRVEKWREPREGVLYFLPTVRYDAQWAETQAVVLAENVPSL